MKKQIKEINSSTKKLLFLCYFIFIVLVLSVRSFYAHDNITKMKQGHLYETPLKVTDFKRDQVQIINDMELITSGDDGKLVYIGDVNNIFIKCTFSANPGEFVSFYNNIGDESFTPNKMIYAKLIDGYYVFEYPAGTKRIRIDMGIFPSIEVNFREIIMNKPTTTAIWGSVTTMLFHMLVIPPVIFAVLSIFTDLFRMIFRKN